MAIVKHATQMQIYLKAQSQHQRLSLLENPRMFVEREQLGLFHCSSWGGCDNIRRQYRGSPVLYPDVRQLSGHLDR